VTQGHGRIERRTLTATSFAAADAAAGRWPALAQMVRVERRQTIRGRTSVEVAYGITSLPPTRADARRLLRLQRGHWGIENGLHYVRDVSLGEDSCRVRSGSAPWILSTLRNVTVQLAHHVGKGVKAATRHWYLYPEKAIALLKGRD
jgi:predicted transposase YbfD/YdcC